MSHLGGRAQLAEVCATYLIAPWPQPAVNGLPQSRADDSTQSPNVRSPSCNRRSSTGTSPSDNAPRPTQATAQSPPADAQWPVDISPAGPVPFPLSTAPGTSSRP